MDIKLKIKKYMDDKKINVYALAKKSGVTQPCIANWFNERNYTPSIDALEKVCDGLEITMAQLFCKDDEAMMPVAAEERKLLEIWQILNVNQRNYLLKLLESIIMK